MLSSKNKLILHFISGLIIIHLLSFIPGNSAVKISSDTTIAVIGEQSIITIYIEFDQIPGDKVQFNAEMLITNPTLFYPDAMLPLDESEVINIKILRINDSSYNLNGSINLSDQAKFGIGLRGFNLAGSDTICILKFSNVRIGGIPLDEFESVILINSSGIPMPYLRIAKIETPYPNPVQSGSSCKFPYNIDKISDISFDLIDINGCTITSFKKKAVNKGRHDLTFDASTQLPAGEYWLRMISNSGTSSVKFMIMK